ncbi:MAG: ribosome hibernation-promoting factor, HPF/YfiA family [Minisyncoccota bacterium]
MKTNIKGTGIELTPAILDYAEKRFEKVEKYLNGDPLMAVELGKITQHHKQGEIFRAEVKISGSGNDYYAEKEASDLYTAIDLVKDEVIGEITKDKSKKRGLQRKGERTLKDMVRGFPWIRWRK